MGLFKSNKIAVLSPGNGEVINLSEVSDPVFAGEMLGKGFAIIPSEGKMVSPINGKVTVVFDTKHAIGLVDDNGTEVLVHIGIDTVKLNGSCFTTHVKPEDKVEIGQLLVEFDIDGIKAAGYETVTPVIVTNSANFKKIKVLKLGQVDYEDEVLQLEK